MTCFVDYNSFSLYRILILNTIGNVILIISVKPIIQDVQLRTELQQIENKLAPMRKQIKGKFLLNTVQLEKKYMKLQLT